MIAGILYVSYETVSFGSHFFARSSQEIICDGIGLIIMSIGCLVAAIERKK
jgi:hypothetical protein